ncbi:MAG: tRNA uridine(34) 5-carboxymethylaminomethyl modification radical SAM/GNAT enzyme Elp3 [bacterium]|nr:tRNA uridine(34) 5-carboxymethylaminomethyl modification radical SAM/GNAT enzyme Elp3 [bacterium]
MKEKLQLAVIELVKNKVNTLDLLYSLKRKISKDFKITLPSNIDLLKAYHELVRNKRIIKNRVLEYLLVKRRVRSLSGIVNVSILTKPYACPGKCLFCPDQPGIPKSYLKKEPAVQRAVLTKFSPVLQIRARLESLKITGHPIDKIELRIIGGTWSFYPKSYQYSFIKKCFDECNGKKSKNLGEAQKINENAKHRIIGITVETRPDYIDEKEIKRLRELGITRVELGVQSIYDDVLKFNRRGHKIKDTINATRQLKDAGFKVSYQIMPNLPGSEFLKDVKMFKELFSNSGFKPDLLKIYPLALVKEAPLYRFYKQKKFKPCSKKNLVKLLVEIKKQIPGYVRIERVIRDIPAEDVIEGGVKTSNLREIVQKELKEQNLKCRCIRCREVGEDYNSKEKLFLHREDYEASEGKEIFLSFENEDKSKLYALLRLRINYENSSRSLAMVREIHTYGQMAPIQEKQRGRTSLGFAQHKGLGKKLMKEAERIAKKEFKADKISVIAGVGVRGYYRKLGYRLENTYMVKKL